MESVFNVECPTNESLEDSKDDGSQRSRRHRCADWERHKLTITRLYLDENKTLGEVMRIMRDQHGFDASQRQYKSRFGMWMLSKNLKSRDVDAMLQAPRNTSAVGKRTELFVRGPVVTSEKIKRHLRRRHLTTTAVILDSEAQADSPETPPGLVEHTPNHSVDGQRSAQRPSSPKQHENDEVGDITAKEFPGCSRNTFTCPFRQRNRARFNVREHSQCAVPTFSISELKHHISDSHMRPRGQSRCPRCQGSFRTEVDLENHISGPAESLCRPKPRFLSNTAEDPEDGIAQETERLLQHDKIDSWESLWQLLFPDDTMVPVSEYLTPIEIDELGAQFWSELDILVHQELAREPDCALLAPYIERITLIYQNSLERMVKFWRQSRAPSDVYSATDAMDMVPSQTIEPVPCRGASLLADVEGPMSQESALTSYAWEESFCVQSDGEPHLESLVDTALSLESSYLTSVTPENELLRSFGRGISVHLENILKT